MRNAAAETDGGNAGRWKAWKNDEAVFLPFPISRVSKELFRSAAEDVLMYKPDAAVGAASDQPFVRPKMKKLDATRICSVAIQEGCERQSRWSTHT